MGNWPQTQLHTDGFRFSLESVDSKENDPVFVWPTSHIGMLHPSGDAKSRNRAADFLKFANAAEEGISYGESKALLDCTTNQAETRKSLFEELGLLYVPHRSNRLVLTPLGKQLRDLLAGEDLTKLSAAKSLQASALLIWALCRTQINRPQSRGVPRPATSDWKNCNVKPYAAAWQASSDLGGKLYLQEFMGVLRSLQRIEDYDNYLARIFEARANKTSLIDRARWANRGPEMNYVIYWRSHLSLAQQLMFWNEDDELLTPNTKLWDIVVAAMRFQSGCGGSKLNSMTAMPWHDADDYFMNVAGAACPPFLATGAPKLTTFDGQTLADLGSYNLEGEAPPTYSLTGGPELCALPLKLPCYHPKSPNRLFRIDDKTEIGTGVIRLKLGLGRPITNLPLLEKALRQTK